MSSFFRHVERGLLWIAFGLIVPVYGFALYLQLSRTTTLSGRPFWFLCGALVTGIFYLLIPRSLFWISTIHEVNHAVAHWLIHGHKRLGSMFVSVTQAFYMPAPPEESSRQDGYEFGEVWVALAPYYLQYLPLIACGIIVIATPEHHWWLSILAGVGSGLFYFDLIYTLLVPQTDITNTGVMLSILVILGMHILLTGTVLCIIFPEASVAGFWMDGLEIFREWMIMLLYPSGFSGDAPN